MHNASSYRREAACISAVVRTLLVWRFAPTLDLPFSFLLWEKYRTLSRVSVCKV